VRPRNFKYALAVVDVILLNLSFPLALYLRFGLDIFITNGYLIASEIKVFFVCSLFCILVFRNNNLYGINIFLDATTQLVTIVRSVFYVIVVLVLLSFFLKVSYILESRLVIVYFGAISIVLVGFTRIAVLRNIFHYLVKSGILRSNVIILSNGVTGQALSESLSVDNTYGFHLVGCIQLEKKGDETKVQHLPVPGNIDTLQNIINEHGIDEIFAVLDNVSYAELFNVLNRCKSTTAAVKVVASQYDVILNSFFAERYDGVPLVTVKERAHRSLYSIEKRVVDILIASIVLILLIPLFLLIAILIKFSSPGPVLFRQTRIGKDGKPFTFYKFRSMKVGSDDTIHREYLRKLMKNEITDRVKKITNDPRVTRIGRFIRRTSIDELPQLINVLKGEMSLVGPRPCLPYEWEMYEPWHRSRLNVIPGCTGVWQVSGRSNVSFNDMVLMDLYYIDNASLWLDMQLILKTIPILLLRKGGY